MTNPSPKWRAVELPGVGAVEVRRPLLRDTAEATGGDVAWWHRCVRLNGVEMTREQVLDLDAEDAATLAKAVMEKRPTVAPPGACSA